MTGFTRRTFLSAAATLPVAPLAFRPGRAFAQAAKRPRLFALIIGINDYKARMGTRLPNGTVSYRDVAKLGGCINDATVIANAVRPLAADTKVLLDGQVSRASFMAAWKDMLAKSQKGDTLLVTYSGHGGQESGGDAGSIAQNPDQLHDTFILPTFNNIDPVLRAERILDDEMQGLWRSVEGRNRVIFVADSCHAGGMTRSVDPRVADGVQYRFGGSYGIEGALTPAVALPTAPTGLELPHVVFLPGAQYNELVPEVPIEGRKQGALSLSFARALSGLADTDKDGVITGVELSSYVLRSVRALSDSSQHPNVRWPHANVVFGLKPEEPLFYLTPEPNGGPVAVPASPVLRPDTDANVVRLQLLNSPDSQRTRLAASLKRGQVLAPPQAGDLTWDAAKGEVLNQLGNLVASQVQADGLQAVVDRTYAINLLRRMVANSGIDMRLLLAGEDPNSPASRDSDRTHKKGTRVALQASGVAYPTFLVFNIGGDGTVQILGTDRDITASGGGFKIDLEVTAPFGADCWVTIASAKPSADLFGSIERLDNTKGAAALIDFLNKGVRTADLRVGIQGVFTAER